MESIIRSQTEWKEIWAAKSGLLRGRTPHEVWQGGWAIVQDMNRWGGLLEGPKKVLDVGCGFGRIAAQLVDKEVIYKGTDISREHIEFCKQVFSPWENFEFEHIYAYNDFYEPEQLRNADTITFSEDDETVDTVICSSLFTHMPSETDVLHYMDEIKRVLKSGGRAWVTFFLSPPNTINPTGERTVISENRLSEYLDGFTIIKRYGGTTTNWHDQVRIIIEKP